MRKKQVVAAAAAVIIGTTAFGMAFSTQAKEIPIIGIKVTSQGKV